MTETDWDVRFFNLAKHVSEWSKDPSKKVGAVIVNTDKHVIGIGYNGFPKGIKDDDRLNDKELKNKMIVHAEINAIHNSNGSVKNCTIYVYPLPPCSRCACQIIAAGITRVVFPKCSPCSKWYDSVILSKQMFTEAGLKMEEM